MSKTIISVLSIIILVFVASLVFIEIENSSNKPSPENNAPASNIQNQSPVVQPVCFIGGCSGQLCSSQPGAISTCEYREEYACYKTATCEVQAGGQCGWTQTVELTSCLMGK